MGSEPQALYRRIGNALLVSDRDGSLMRHLRPVLVGLLDRDLKRFPPQDAQHFVEALSAHAPAELRELLQDAQRPPDSGLRTPSNGLSASLEM
ncbi:hypothetical protein [Streptomyces avermitilis]|uniref:hypothetical protein n=1 Tax=Streptomyces avermitilis TaxID=33903 RepID=UPI0036B658B8